MLNLLLLLINIILVSVVRTQSHPQDETFARPEWMEDYISLREECNWIPFKGKIKHCHAKNAYTCRVETELPEGKGFIHYYRIGPITSTGGMQMVGCEFTAEEETAPIGSFVTREVGGPIDPYTFEYLGYPPIHIHHAYIDIKDALWPPKFPAELKKYLPWAGNSFIGTSSTSQCFRENGAQNCYSKVLPTGYAGRKYHGHEPDTISYDMQDARDINSPPISTSYEYGVFYLTEPNPSNPPLKIIVPAMFAVGSDDVFPYTYTLKYNTEMYQFVTYFCATKMELTANKAHFHSVAGDEMWIVRGTQEDLGIPKHLHRPVMYKRSGHKGAVAAPLELEEGDSIEAMKIRSEENIRKAAAKFEANSNDDEKALLLQKRRAQAIKLGSYTFDFMLQYDPDNHLPSPASPEILCKYYGASEYFSDEDKKAAENEMRISYELHNINLSRRRLTNNSTDVWTNTSRKLENGAVSQHGPLNSMGWGKFPSSEEEPSGDIVSPEDQLKNFYTGVRPGNYYRSPVNSMQRKESRYTQCNSFKVEAGEYITILHFNAPRTYPPDGEYDPSRFVSEQHTRFTSEIHLPDIPWFTRYQQ